MPDLKKTIRILMVGSRTAPPAALDLMARISASFSDLNRRDLPFTIEFVSGGAEGVDTAAERAFAYGKKKIILAYPAEGCNDSSHIVYQPDPDAIRLVDHLHPDPPKRGSRSRRFLERDVIQVIGPMRPDGGREPVDFVVAWTPEGRLIGGTAMAIRTAWTKKIRVYNVDIPQDLVDLRDAYAAMRDGRIPDFHMTHPRERRNR